jgi:hypothetical protein
MLFAIFLLCAASSAAFAQKATVLRVVVVKTDNTTAYAQEIEKGRQIMKSLGITAQTRVWQARFLADAYAKTNASSDYQNWIKDLDKIRKIVSDSLYTEW